MINMLILRGLFVVLLGCAGYFLSPFSDFQSAAVACGGLAGLVVGLGIVLFEVRLKEVSLKRLIGAAIGSTLGIMGAFLMAMVLNWALAGHPTSPAFPPDPPAAVDDLHWAGRSAVTRATCSTWRRLGGVFGGEMTGKQAFKILDTSVIIDGRIADIAETGFLDGTLVIPQFVLRELQLVADSADSMKRNRGRRGLDILQRIQKMGHLNVQIIEDDFPNVRDVDMKLIELGKVYECKVVTNDFNLNKMAQLHGVEVLNINELANALKPIVLPGEVMRVFILKEGKEYNQGVAYLDDGTMVVVDNAKRLISKTIDISVTSVLQTTAGKMIFGRFDERVHAVYDKQQAAGQHADKHDRPHREQPAAASLPPSS